MPPPSRVAVKNCIVAIAERVAHCAPEQPGSDEWDTLADDAENRVWLWRVRDLKLLAHCAGGAAAKLAVGRGVKLNAVDPCACS